jgi:hypothetical protein
VRKTNEPFSESPLSAEQARGASPDELRHRLVSAPLRYLEGAVNNPELAPDEMALLLRNTAASAALLGQVARDRAWTRHYEVKKGLVRHPKTPFPAARNLVGHLYWRDLADTVDDARIQPALRRQAELVLTDRVNEMSLGEQISMARRATGTVISALCGSDEARVLQALLGNPRVKELHAVSVASGNKVPAEVLGWLARHPKWGDQRSIRMALLRNPRTPVAESLKLVARLPIKDVARLCDDDEAPRIVRVGADRRLEAMR